MIGRKSALRWLLIGQNSGWPEPDDDFGYVFLFPKKADRDESQ